MGPKKDDNEWIFLVALVPEKLMFARRMKASFMSYLMRASVLWAVCLVAGEVLFRSVFQDERFYGFFFSVSFSFLVSLLGYSILNPAIHCDRSKIVQRFLLRTTIRIFLYLIFMIVWGLSISSHQETFLLTMLCLYIIFSTFEIMSLLHVLKKPIL